MRRCVLTMVGAALLAAPGARAADLLAFWNTPQRGANSFNGAPPDAAYFMALRGVGATWVRLAFGKWPSRERDFLLGSADEYETLVAADLVTLRATLDRAHAAGLKVVITPLSLPGARAKRESDAPFDDRLWSDKKYWRESAAFWRDLAAELKDHPAVAAYNLVNEPVPERKGGLAEGAPADVARAWQATISGTARDLPAFYGSLTAAIRAVDPVTPVMVEPGWYASAFAFDYWPAPLADARVLYAFHMYEPWSATGAPNMKRKQPYRYPGRVPYADAESRWDAARIEAFTQQPVDWARRHGLPTSRIVAGELGCMRRWADCPRYLEDVLTALEDDGLHWAFYAFREDVWDGMDYELGAAKVPWPYWDAVAQGKPYALPRGPNRVFEPISRRLRQR